MREPTFPGCRIRSRPVGLFRMSDEKGRDEKVLCVPVGDPEYEGISDLHDVPKSLLKEIEHFFSVYKDLEDKVTRVEGWASRAEALDCLRKARAKASEH